MLNRREFLKLSGALAAGAVITLSSLNEVAAAWSDPPPREAPLYRLHGHSRSGCAYRPELADIWSGGGAQLPDMI